MAIFSRKTKPAPGHADSSPTPSKTPDVGEDRRIYELGIEMLDLARKHKAGLLSARFYQDKLMDWAMKDHEFKVQLFRFVDAFPVLTTPEMVHDHLVDYLTQPGVKPPPGMDLALKAGGIAKGIAAKSISSQIKGMASTFIAGTDAKSALPGLREMWKDGIAFSVDLLGEACLSDAEADAYQRKYYDLITNLPGEVAGWTHNQRLESDHLGGIPRTNVSIKISSLSGRLNPMDHEGSINDLMTRLMPLLEAARERGVFVNFDIEQFEVKDLTLDLFMRCCETVDFHAGLAMQAYLKSGVADATRICDWARRTGRIVSVRLVKGAYWDYETIHAEEHGWHCPVWNEKWATDRCFEDMTHVLLEACPAADGGEVDASTLGPTARKPGRGGVKLALGSHNVRSIGAALAGLEKRGLPRNAIELQMLHGMADQLKAAAEDMGLRVREYVPVGEMIPGMAYLVRRLLENTSNESWLKAGFLDNASPEVLLAPPAPTGEPEKKDLYLVGPERHSLSTAVEGVGDGRPFFNEPLRDFSEASIRGAFASAVASARVPEIANDHTPEQAAAMVAAAEKAFETWRDVDPLIRSDVLVRVAAKMRQRRDEISGIALKEAGKPWIEADADVCEAIDFCEYYARESVHLFRRDRLGRFIGELDEQWYQPRGVAVIISPWNFPVAICCGMTAAALVCGNTTIIKPAEQTPGIARVMYDIFIEAMHEAGVHKTGVQPEQVLQFCPAPGETTGASLVRDPRVAILAFTGSKAVGLDIIEAAGRVPQSPPEVSPPAWPASCYPQTHVKKVVCEMGGKNAIIIDTSADLDEAVLGVRYSTFAFDGQKCSACSRCIVVDPAGPDGPHIKTFIDRLVEATRTLAVADPILPGSDMGPVIDDDAAANIQRHIETAKNEGAMLALGETTNAKSSPGESTSGTIPNNYIQPHIFTGITPEHTLAREEVFGPVLAVMHAHDFDEALRIANSHAYKLTGGVFSRKPAHIEKAKRQFRVGNLYINRGCTGALVARQPFGGFGLSGVGSKAGGKDYLLQFVEPRASCENTMRRGFAPEL
jgi:RHH-type transcriptional regulator, proline utilization regulon repressor / proline dehydrogenase / delta 1-pyrroline-5-carboxylate dehydrogenase